MPIEYLSVINWWTPGERPLITFTISEKNFIRNQVINGKSRTSQARLQDTKLATINLIISGA